MKNTAANTIIDALTPAAIRARLSVSESSVRMARQGIPAKWYLVILSMCEAQDIDCPHEAFNFMPEDV